MHFSNPLLNIIKGVFLFVSLFSYLYVSIYNLNDKYTLLPLLPLTYFLSFAFFFSKRLNNQSSIFFIVLVIISFFRYVVLPAAIVYSGYYGGRSPIEPTEETFYISICLMIYELLIISLLVFVLERKNQLVLLKDQYSLKLGLRNNLVFVLFILATILYLIFDKSWLLITNFFTPNELSEELKELVSTEVMFGSYLLMIIKQLIFILVIYYLKNKYKINKNPIILFLVLLCVVINIGIFSGTNRSDVLLTAMVSFLVVIKLFPIKFIKASLIIGSISLAFLISQITEVRNFSSISRGQSELVDRTDFLQAYLGGPYNVAIALETKTYYPEAKKPEVLFFDVFRPMLGFNILVKDLPYNYSNIYFNRRMFLNDNRSQILPMIGQGNLYFGYIFSPIFSVIFVFIAYYLLRVLKKSANLLIFYFFSLSIARMGFMMGQNTMNMINDLSFNLFLFIIVYWLNNKTQFKNV